MGTLLDVTTRGPSVCIIAFSCKTSPTEMWLNVFTLCVVHLADGHPARILFQNLGRMSLLLLE